MKKDKTTITEGQNNNKQLKDKVTINNSRTKEQ